MGIYIKDMEVPKSCSVCPMLEGHRMDGFCHAASKWLDDDEHWIWYVYPEGDMDDSKPCNCPLVPVPPHGKLVDADAICEGRVSNDNVVICLKCAPTIIPASEEGET